LPINRTQLDGGYGTPQTATNAFNTASQAPTSKVTADEFGNVQRTASQTSGNASQQNATGSIPSAAPASITRRTTSPGGTTPFTVANPHDASNDARQSPSRNGPATSTNNANPPGWLKAEDEKVQLYEKARARAERIQGVIVANVGFCLSSIE
jgi:hypothetical protein